MKQHGPNRSGIGLAAAISGIWLLAAATVPLSADPQAERRPSAEAAEASEPPERKRGEEDEDESEPLDEYSDTGYIDSAVVATRLHLRVDAAFGNDQPDRAEFFYAKGGYYRELGPPFDPDAPGPGVSLDLTRNVALQLREEPFIEVDLDYQDLVLDFEYAVNRRFSLFLEAAVRAIEPAVVASKSGLADLGLGFKYAFVASPRRYVTFQFRGYLPTGDARDGLGTDHVALEPGILHFERLGDRLTLESELRFWYPTSGASARGAERITNNRNVLGVNQPPLRVPDPAEDFFGEVLRYGVGLGYRFDPRPGVRVTPVVELVGWEVLGGFSTVSDDGTGIPIRTLESGGSGPFNFAVREADGDSIVNLKVGVRLGLRSRESVYLGYGVPLTRQAWYDAIFRLEYRLSY